MLFDAGVSAVHVGVHTEFNQVAVGMQLPFWYGVFSVSIYCGDSRTSTTSIDVTRDCSEFPLAKFVH